MSEEKAIETEEELGFEITEGPEDEAVVKDTEDSETETTETETEELAASEEDDDGEVEIVLEGEDEPTSTPAPRGVRRLINRVSAAKAEASEAEKRAEALDAENRMLRARMQQDIEDKEPNLDDFDTDAEYQTALKDFYKREAKKTAAEETQRLIAESHQQNTQAQTSRVKQSLLDEHYQRADKSGIKNYDALEEAAIDVIGQQFVEEIAAKCDKSEVVLAHLGTNRGKAERFARLFQDDPVKALLDIGTLAGSLRVERKHSRAANPAVTIDKGIAGDSIVKGARFE